MDCEVVVTIVYTCHSGGTGHLTLTFNGSFSGHRTDHVRPSGVAYEAALSLSAQP